MGGTPSLITEQSSGPHLERGPSPSNQRLCPRLRLPGGDPNLSALLGQGLLCPRDGEMGGPGLGPEPPQTRQRNRSQPSWLPARSRLPGGLANSWAGLLPGLAGSA